MTYLQLCARVVKEAGIAGGGPTTVLNQSGQLLQVVNWVAQAWEDIQIMRPNWLFMHNDFNFNTVIDTRDYAPMDISINDLALWDYGSFLLYDAALGESDEIHLPYTSYGEWRTAYRSGMNDRALGRPVVWTKLPNGSIRFEPDPDKVYTINGEYKNKAQLFTADADVPTGLPDDFHILIVWQALKSYGFHQDAPEVLDQAETNFDNLLYRLEIEQLPDFSEDREGIA